MEAIAKKKRELKGLEPTLLTLRTRVEELGRERESIEGKVKALDERRAAGAETAKELAAAAKGLQQQAKSLASAMKGERERRKAAEERLGEVVGMLRSSKAEHRQSERERKSAEALDNLQRLFPGVHGRMTDICKIAQRKYHKAVTNAMGKSFEAIVVDNSKTAVDCIHYLKEKKCAPEQFLPLDSIRGQPVREGLRQLGGSKLPVFDVVTCADQFLPALQFAVGDAVVCDTLDEARELAFKRAPQSGEKYKVVTVDGFMISKAGLMSGLGADDKARASKWNQKEHEQLKGEQEALRKELDALGTPLAADEKETALRHELASKQHEAAAAQADLETTTQKLSTQRQELDAVYNAMQDAERALKECEEKVATGEAEVAEIAAKRDAEEDKIFAKFSKSLGIDSVRDYEESTLRQVREREASLLSLQGRLSQLEAKISFEKRKDLPEAVRKLDAAVADDEKFIAMKSEKMARATSAADGLKAQAAEAEERAKASREAQEKAGRPQGAQEGAAQLRRADGRREDQGHAAGERDRAAARPRQRTS